MGVLTGYLGVALGYLLAQAGLNAEQIAGLIALSFIPQTWKFIWAPLVDTTLSRRRWYVLSVTDPAFRDHPTGEKLARIPTLDRIIVGPAMRIAQSTPLYPYCDSGMSERTG